MQLECKSGGGHQQLGVNAELRKHRKIDDEPRVLSVRPLNQFCTSHYLTNFQHYFQYYYNITSIRVS